MTPYLIDNDQVTLEPVDPENIRLGDLVYALQPGLPPLLHRVIGRMRGSDGSWTVLTKGDALLVKDPAVPVAAVAGRVVAVRRTLPAGAFRDVLLRTRRQRILQHALALSSRQAPRVFKALSRRLVPVLEKLRRYPAVRVSAWR